MANLLLSYIIIVLTIIVTGISHIIDYFPPGNDYAILALKGLQLSGLMTKLYTK